MLVSFYSHAQITDDNSQIIASYFQKNNASHFTKSLNFLENNAKNNEAFEGSLFIINQTGNKNFIEIKAASKLQKVEQIGDENKYEFLSYYGKSNLQFDIHQAGKRNSIQILGENSIINEMTILQKSNHKTITIVNH